MENKNIFDLIIIGAGISGISCANEIKKNGLSYKILEGKNRIGGRIHTIDINNQKIELGASFIHGKSYLNPIYGNEEFILEKCIDLNLQFRKFKNYDCPTVFKRTELISDSQKKLTSKLLNRNISRIIELRDKHLSGETIIENAEELSVYDFLEKFIFEDEDYMNFTEIQKDYLKFLIWEMEEYDGCDLEKQSFLLYNLDEFIPGNVSLLNGYSQLIANLANGLEIQLDCEVESIENYESDKITIKTSQGIYYCKGVVLSVSLGVLKSNQIKFYPSLPEYKIQCINRMEMGTMNKIVLEFENQFWDENIYRIKFVSDIKGEFPWIENCTENIPILYFWLACSFAEKLEEESDETIIERIMKILRNIYSNKTVKDPISYFISRWKKDKFSFGSYSTRVKGGKINDNILLGKNQGNLYFCGEATSQKYPGTVHGAYLTGIHTASEILYKNKNSKISEIVTKD